MWKYAHLFFIETLLNNFIKEKDNKDLKHYKFIHLVDFLKVLKTDSKCHCLTLTLSSGSVSSLQTEAPAPAL